MSAELLREAAALMRERAEAATPAPWKWTDSEAVNDVWEGGMTVVGPDGDPIANVCDEWYENDPGEPAPINDAEHIASWHPAVALAVAGWLEAEARAMEFDIGAGLSEREAAQGFEALITVARTYLGRVA